MPKIISEGLTMNSGKKRSKLRGISEVAAVFPNSVPSLRTATTANYMPQALGDFYGGTASVSFAARTEPGPPGKAEANFDEFDPRDEPSRDVRAGRRCRLSKA